ncbi:UNVERIFIED_CONTAM: Sorting nexin, cytoplasm-to-vacuole targeting pathway/endosomal sorting [Siphonaria sp. JEL0065]|nr:Sorting nexin, cytoplasm-to-vacuole targeting pathway/endosomal sorting [Siphonaria sp. JEL0065]
MSFDPLGASTLGTEEDVLSDPLAASFAQSEEEDEELETSTYDADAAAKLQREIENELNNNEEKLREKYLNSNSNDLDQSVHSHWGVDDEGSQSHTREATATSTTQNSLYPREDEDEGTEAHSNHQQPQAQCNPHLLQKTKSCCTLDRILCELGASVFNPILTSAPLAEQEKPAILIEETQKLSDAGTSSYTAYIIKISLPEPFQATHFECRHRYSDFETLHRLLRRMHPTILVPPIPEKHSVADYAARPMSGKPKEDLKMVEGRKRGLQFFLNRVAMHPILKREHVFHGFLEGEKNGMGWSEVLAQSGVSHFLKMKDVKKVDVGIRVGDAILKRPNAHFLAAEDYTFKFGQQLSLLLKYHKKMHKHLTESATTGSDLGAAYNGWSLTETGASAILAPEIEALGEAIDCTVTSQHKLLHIMQEHVTEPLQNYEKLTAAIDKTLKWRHVLHVDYETVAEGLENNRNNLQMLETRENDAQRLASALRSELNGGPPPLNPYTSHFPSIIGSSSSTEAGFSQHQQQPQPTEAEEEPEDPNDPYAATRRALSKDLKPKPSSTSLSTSSITPSSIASAIPKPTFPPSSANILSSFSSFLTDKDPETTRRHTILRTQEKIRSLESERVAHLSRVAFAGDAIQQDLDRFQRDKIVDLRNMLLTCAVANRDHARRCLGAWREASSVINGAGGGGGRVGLDGGLDENEVGNCS